MLLATAYFAFLFFELFLAFSIFVYITSLLFSSFKGAPYVPTKNASIYEVLKNAGLKKGQKIIELGCGDGRVVRNAVQKFNLKGTGVDINSILILIAKIKHRNLKNLSFRTQNIYKTSLSSYDAVYVFLMPEMLVKLKQKFIKECRKGTLIISHGFKIAGWDKKIKKVLERKPFPTYYYRI